MNRAPFSPPLLVLTDGAATGGRPLVEVVAAALAGGARAVLVREKHLPRPERAGLAAALGRLLAEVGGLLLVASDGSLPADGLHLAAGDPFPSSRPPIVGRSCHSRAEVEAAAQEGCDYAT
ncbi:MAG TPA: thiamine phosphate synthase, partial [Acidimicrobiales bacterium]|nr:thiamine phosphate synthase [Acidimicrobiales bacterium]